MHAALLWPVSRHTCRCAQSLPNSSPSSTCCRNPTFRCLRSKREWTRLLTTTTNSTGEEEEEVVVVEGGAVGRRRWSGGCGKGGCDGDGALSKPVFPWVDPRSHCQSTIYRSHCLGGAPLSAHTPTASRAQSAAATSTRRAAIAGGTHGRPQFHKSILLRASSSSCSFVTGLPRWRAFEFLFL